MSKTIGILMGLALAAGLLAGQAMPPVTSLEGVVRNALTGEPVARVQVILSRDKEPAYHVLSDASGRFTFTDIAPGEYKVTGKKNGYADATFGQPKGDGDPIPLARGERRTGVELRMAPAAVIAGRVLDNNGEPVPGVLMFSARMGYNGRRRELKFLEYSVQVTNDRGEYRLYGLPPDRYYVTALPVAKFLNFNFFGHGSGGDPSDPVATEELTGVFYPGVPDLGQAAAVELRPGEERAGIDIRYDYAPLVNVRGFLAPNPACPGEAHIQMAREIEDNRDYPKQEALDPEGRFELRGVPLGAWRVSASTNQEQISCSTETVSVQVGRSGADGVTLALRPYVQVSGVVRMEGDPGFVFKGVGVRAETLEGGDAEGVSSKPDGSFALKMEPRAWSMAVTDAPPNAYIKSARAGETDLLDAGLNLAGGGAPGRLEIVLSNAGAKVDATVLDDAGQPVAGVRVVLVPEPRLRAHGRLFKDATTDFGGRVSLTGIAPGDYKLFAWEDVEEEAYRDPEYLRAYEDRGEKISFGEGETKRALLKPISR
jgi:protocatechuate 3,4-dioxygenase beta subunit